VKKYNALVLKRIAQFRGETGLKGEGERKKGVGMRIMSLTSPVLESGSPSLKGGKIKPSGRMKGEKKESW